MKLPRLFHEGVAVIVAGGPSLVGFDWSSLDGLPVLAVNRAFEKIAGARAIYWSDYRFYTWHAEALFRHRAWLKTTCEFKAARCPSWIVVLKRTGTTGYDPEPGTVRTGNSSGYAALHLAPHLGARRVALLGFDYRFAPSGEAHWHGEHPIITRERVFATKMAPLFDGLAPELARIGVEVVNGSPSSLIGPWPKTTPAEAVAWARGRLAEAA
jgi:hypothetical protein